MTPRKVARRTGYKLCRGPKRLSGYQLLLKECLTELKLRNPGCSMVLPLVSKLCAERWQGLDDRTKSMFQEEADRINSRASTISSAMPMNEIPLHPHPKRPLSAFILFCKDHRGTAKRENPGTSMVQISTVLSSMWTGAEPETRLKYQSLSKNQREAYKKEMESAKEKDKYTANLGDEEVQDNEYDGTLVELK